MTAPVELDAAPGWMRARLSPKASSSVEPLQTPTPSGARDDRRFVLFVGQRSASPLNFFPSGSYFAGKKGASTTEYTLGFSHGSLRTIVPELEPYMAYPGGGFSPAIPRNSTRETEE